MSGDENLFYVKTPDGDVHRVTLDQLDEAFNAGRIDENVMVLASGATKWMKLGELAGLDEPTQTPPPATFAPMPNSLRPVSMDLSLDLDDNAFQKKSRKGLVVGTMVGILAIFGGILGANRLHLGTSSADSSTAAAAAVAPTPAPPPPPTPAAAPDPAPSPSPAAAAPSPAPTDSAASKLSEEQRKKLSAADKALEAKLKAHKKGRAVAAGGSRSKIKAQGFSTGGNKFDPLNASM